MDNDIRKIKREIVFPLLLQSLSAGALASSLVIKIFPLIDSYNLFIIKKILGIANNIDYGALCEVFIKISLFIIIQFIALCFLFQVFSEILCKIDMSFLDAAFIVSKPASLSALLLACSLPWLFLTPAAIIPFIFASFILTILYNHTSICTTFNINMNAGVFLTTSVYLIYFTFILICINKT